MRLYDILIICFLFIVLGLVVYFGMKSDEATHKQIVELNTNFNNIEIYSNCYNISNLYYCIKEVN